MNRIRMYKNENKIPEIGDKVRVIHTQIIHTVDVLEVALNCADLIVIPNYTKCGKFHLTTPEVVEYIGK